MIDNEILKEIFRKSNFWAVQVAKKAIERAERNQKKEIVVRCASTPTGVLHIGNANELIRSAIVAKAIEVLGKKAKVVYTSDNRDPLRGFPSKIADKDGNIIDFKEREYYEENFDGSPVFSLPDPFNCHFSWEEHFLELLFKELEELGIKNIEKWNPNLLYYNDKKWYGLMKIAINNKDKVNEILSKLKEHVREFPLGVICENCGKIGTTHVLDYDKDKEEVTYICESRHLKKKTVKGCGYKGKTKLRNCKLDWYVEWAVNWAYFDADVEPMGKEHYLSSWKISPLILKEIYGKEEPIPVLYELFTIDGKKMSSSKGNIYNITYFLKLLEPEVFIYYLYTKRPFVQREITLSKLNQATDEFDKLEENFYETLNKIKKEGIDSLSQDEIDNFVNYYLSKLGNINNYFKKVNYSFLAIIGQLLLPRELLENTEKPLVNLDIDVLERNANLFKKIKEILVRTGHINEEIDEFDFYKIIDRMRKAAFWAKKHGPDYLRIELNQDKVEIEFDDNEKEIIKYIISKIDELKNKENIDLDELQTQIHSKIAEKLDAKKFYKKLYKALINKNGGPKLSSLIIAEREKIKELLEKYIQ